MADIGFFSKTFWELCFFQNCFFEFLFENHGYIPEEPMQTCAKGMFLFLITAQQLTIFFKGGHHKLVK
jgi:hypothetical protein